MPIVAPSILAADFSNLEKAAQLVNESAADWLHFDVMDGRFVPNISFGFPVLTALKKHLKKPIDVHLMIVEPEKYIEQFVEAGADILSVHYEACPHLHRTIQQIHKAGAKAGVALNPHTPVFVLQDIIQELDLVCIMSVNPGFGGQQFIEKTYERVKQLKRLIEHAGSKTLIEIDGGVGPKNAQDLLKAGADVLVAGSSVFKAENPMEAIKKFKLLSKDNLTV